VLQVDASVRNGWAALGAVILAILAWVVHAGEPPAVNPFASSGEEPPALNPFGPVQRDRDDAVPGYVELSNGDVYVGRIYMTRDKRLKVYDKSMERQREIPLRVVRQIECRVVREWMEKEWRFKELALDEKYYTGRTYPVRQYEHTITLKDGRTITGPLAEIIYVQGPTYKPDQPLRYRPPVKPLRFILHKRDKGKIGSDLKSLHYVKLVKLGEDALEEGRRKARESHGEQPSVTGSRGAGRSPRRP